MTDYHFGPGADNQTAPAAGDQLFGGDGADTLNAVAGGNRLVGDAGDDVLNGAAGNDTLEGGSDPNITEHNVLNGFGGDDLIISGSWGDQIAAGDGNDVVQVTAMRTGQTVDGGADDDVLFLVALSEVSQNLSVRMGSTFQPVVGGIAGATYFNFEAVYVVGGRGANYLFGGGGDDTLLNSYSNVATFRGGILRGGGGNDEIGFHGLPEPGAGAMLLDGGTGAGDVLVWSNGLASWGAIDIDAAAGTMTADGLTFATFSRFEAYRIQTYPGATGAFAFTGGNGADVLDICAGTSTLALLGGDDVVNLRSGASVLRGGQGNDSIIADFADAAGLQLYGDSGNDLIRGASGQSTLSGGSGNDSLTSFNGSSQLGGGDGDDVLYLSASYSMAGTGAPLISGGAGHDRLTLEYSSFATAFSANFANPNLVLADGTRVIGLEAVVFSSGSGDDNLFASNDLGGAAENGLLGGGGNDTLHAAGHGARLDGGTGLDLLIGAGGADSLDGSLGDDVLRGGAGNDTLVGGYGRDVMSGGADTDIFLFTFASQTGNTAATRDVITDFHQAEHDRIDVSRIDADGNYGNGVTPFTFIGTAGFHGVAGELRVHKIDLAGTAHDVTLILGDISGTGTSQFQIALKGLVTLTEADFMLA